MCVLLWFVMKLVGDFHLDCIKVDLLYFWVAYIAYASCHSWDSNGDPGTAWSSRLATFAFIQRISQPGPSFDRTLQILAALITSGAEMHFHHAKSTGTVLIFFGACEGWMQTVKQGNCAEGIVLPGLDYWNKTRGWFLAQRRHNNQYQGTGLTFCLIMLDAEQLWFLYSTRQNYGKKHVFFHQILSGEKKRVVRLSEADFFHDYFFP